MALNKYTLSTFLIKELANYVNKDQKIDMAEVIENNKDIIADAEKIFADDLAKTIGNQEFDSKEMSKKEIFTTLASLSSQQWLVLRGHLEEDIINGTNAFNTQEVNINKFINNLKKEAVLRVENLAPHIYAKKVQEALYNGKLLKEDAKQYISTSVVLNNAVDNEQDNEANIIFTVSKSCNNFEDLIKDEEMKEDFEKFKDDFYKEDKNLQNIVGTFLENQTVYFESSLLEHFSQQVLRKKETEILNKEKIDTSMAPTIEKAKEIGLLDGDKYDKAKEQLRIYSISQDYIDAITKLIDGSKDIIDKQRESTKIEYKDGKLQLVTSEEEVKDPIKFKEIDWESIKRKIKEEISHKDVLLDQISETDILDEARNNELHGIIMNDVVKEYEYRELFPRFLLNYISNHAVDLNITSEAMASHDVAVEDLANNKNLKNADTRKIRLNLYQKENIDPAIINREYELELEMIDNNNSTISKLYRQINKDANKDVYKKEFDGVKDEFKYYQDIMLGVVTSRCHFEEFKDQYVREAKDSRKNAGSNVIEKNKCYFDIRTANALDIVNINQNLEALDDMKFRLVYQAVSMSNILDLDRNHLARDFIGNDEYQEFVKYTDREKANPTYSTGSADKRGLTRFIIEKHSPEQINEFMKKMKDYSVTKSPTPSARGDIFDRINDMLDKNMIKSGTLRDRIDSAIQNIKKVGSLDLAKDDRMHDTLVGGGLFTEEEWNKYVETLDSYDKTNDKEKTDNKDKTTEKDVEDQIIDHFSGQVQATVRLTAKDLRIFSQKILERNRKAIKARKEKNLESKAFEKLIEVAAREYDRDHSDEYKTVNKIIMDLNKSLTIDNSRPAMMLTADLRNKITNVLSIHGYNIEDMQPQEFADVLRDNFGCVIDQDSLKFVHEAFLRLNSKDDVLIHGYLIPSKVYDEEVFNNMQEQFEAINSIEVSNDDSNVIKLDNEKADIVKKYLQHNNLLRNEISNIELANRLRDDLGIVISYEDIVSKASLVDLVNDKLLNNELPGKALGLEGLMKDKILRDKLSNANVSKVQIGDNTQTVIKFDDNTKKNILDWFNANNFENMSNKELAYNLKTLYGINIGKDRVDSKDNLYNEIVGELSSNGFIQVDKVEKEKPAEKELKDKKVSELSSEEIDRLEEAGIEVDTTSSAAQDATLKEYLSSVKKGDKNTLSQKDRDYVVRQLKIEQGKLFQSEDVVNLIKKECIANKWLEMTDNDQFAKILRDRYQIEFLPDPNSKESYAQQFKWQLDHNALCVMCKSKDEEVNKVKEEILKNIEDQNKQFKDGIIDLPKNTLIKLRRQLLKDDSIINKMDNEEFANYLKLNYGIMLSDSQMQSTNLKENLMSSLDESIDRKETGMIEINQETIAKMRDILGKEDEWKDINNTADFAEYLLVNYGLTFSEERLSNPNLKDEFIDFIKKTTNNVAIKGDFIKPDKAMQDLRLRQSFAVRVKDAIEINDGVVQIKLSDADKDMLATNLLVNEMDIRKMDNNRIQDYLKSNFNITIKGNLKGVQLAKQILEALNIKEYEKNNETTE